MSHIAGSDGPVRGGSAAATMEARPWWCAMAETRPRGRFLLTAIDAGGTLPPALGLAAELVRRGQAVLVLSDPISEAAVRAAGCDFRPWRQAPHIDSIDEQTALIADMESGNGLQQLRAAGKHFLVGPAAGFAADVVATVREHPVDAVLADGLPGMLIGAQ